MTTESVGIGDIAIYIPEQRIDLQTLAEYRVRSIPALARHFERALRTTGQRSIRFPYPWEDSATLAATAALTLLTGTREPGARRREHERMRYLVAGTETGLDHSKPVSAYVQGMLREAGVPVPDSIASYQMQHACAGATAAIITTAAMLAVSGTENEFGVVTAADIARYEGKSTAEVTQGAGAAAILVERNPRLLELDVAAPGYCSQDVDDFFRPLGSVTAVVKGQYSMQCYRNSLEGALIDYASRHGREVRDVLLETDYFVLHAPFRNMPLIALEKMFERHAGMSAEETREHLELGGLTRALEPIAETGNTYTASVYINLASLLTDRLRVEGDAIRGKNILIGSYGSGSTMILLGARITDSAPSVIRTWPENLLGRSVTATTEDYERWMAGPEYAVGVDSRTANAAAESPAGELHAVSPHGEPRAAVGQPGAAESALPGAARPHIVMGDAARSGGARPETTGAPHPGSIEPETDRPLAPQPGSRRPDAVQRETAVPEAPGPEVGRGTGGNRPVRPADTGARVFYLKGVRKDGYREYSYGTPIPAQPAAPEEEAVVQAAAVGVASHAGNSR